MSELTRQDAANDEPEPQYVLLEEWAEKAIRPAPSLYTLRSMARTGRIDPPAVKIGKAYYVEPGSKVVDPNRRLTLVERLKQA